MNLYAHDLSLFEFANFSDDPIAQGYRVSSAPFNSSITYFDDDDDDDDESSISFNSSKNKAENHNFKSPPSHRHDGTSPLPLGMDWSLPPRKWDGRDTIWPHDSHTGWSYCVTVPSWIFLPKSSSSDPVVFYRVQVGIQSPEGITTTRGILRRFSDFLKLLSDLKKAFPKKKLPPAPPKRILKTKSRTLLEERRYSLEDWMEKLLSDIDISRSAPVAMFLELEAAARSSFDDEHQQFSDANSSLSGMVPSFLYHTSSDVSLFAGSSSIASDHGNDSPEEISELGTPRHEMHNHAYLGMENSMSERSITVPVERAIKHSMFGKNINQDNLEKFSRPKVRLRGDSSNTGLDKLSDNTTKDKSSFANGSEIYTLDGHVRRLSVDSVGSDQSSVRASVMSNLAVAHLCGEGFLDQPEDAEASKNTDALGSSKLWFPRESLVVIPSDERQKLNRVLNTLEQRLGTAKTDIEDLIARLNQEVAVRQFLTTKVKDLEVELETTTENCKESMQQAVLNEREKFTQMQWDLEELRKQRLEMELKLKSEQDEKARLEAAKMSIIEENKMLLHDLDIARESLENLHKHHEELEMKSKADVKILVKEVKSLRSSQSELKQELSRVMKEKLEVERVLQKEKQRMELANSANSKLLHECEILHNRLQECSVNFLVEEEDKLIVDTSSPSDAIDLLTTSDNRIGLLLAEAQLLAQDIENSVARVEGTHKIDDNDRRDDDDLRKMLTDTFVDNARLRMQVNSVIRCALSTYVVKSDKDDEEEDTPFRNTVLSKFLER